MGQCWDVGNGKISPLEGPKLTKSIAEFNCSRAHIALYPAGSSIVVEGEHWEGKANICEEVLGSTVEGNQAYLKVKEQGFTRRRS